MSIAERRERLRTMLQPPAVGHRERDLLGSCLLPSSEVAQAWARVAADGPAFRLPPAFQALQGYLADRLAIAGLRPDEPLASQLRAAKAIELQRNEALQAIAASILTLKAVARSRPTLLGGLATSVHAWSEPMLRHTSRIALLFPSARAAAEAAMALAETAAYVVDRQGAWIGSALRLKHESGMPVILHGGYCAAPAWGMTYQRLAAQAVAQKIGGQDALVCDPAACFAFTAIDALKPGADSSLLWLADAVLLLRLLPRAAQTSFLPPAAIVPLIRRARQIDGALEEPEGATAERGLVQSVAALRGLRTALAAVGAPAKLYWLLRLGPGVAASTMERRLRPALKPA